MKTMSSIRRLSRLLVEALAVFLLFVGILQPRVSQALGVVSNSTDSGVRIPHKGVDFPWPLESMDPPLAIPFALREITVADLRLQLDYPTLEVFENRAYIPLFFTIRAPDFESSVGTNDLTVRATLIGGTATSGVDFDGGELVRIVRAGGGANSLNWVEVPLIQDEINEGTHRHHVRSCPRPKEGLPTW